MNRRKFQWVFLYRLSVRFLRYVSDVVALLIFLWMVMIKKAIFCLDGHQYAREVSEIKIIWTFYKIGQAGGRTSLSLIFSLTSSALDHSATTPPSLKEHYDFVGLNPGRHWDAFLLSSSSESPTLSSTRWRTWSPSASPSKFCTPVMTRFRKYSFCWGFLFFSWSRWGKSYLKWAQRKSPKLKSSKRKTGP